MLRHELRANTEETRDVKHLLTGNGEPAKGLIVRMDRIEQAKVRQDWLAGVALTAAIGAVGTTLWHKLTGKG